MQSASRRLDADALSSETDVTVGQPVRQLVGRETATVVLDDELELAGGLDEAECRLGCLGMPHDIGQELTRRREDELLLWVTASKEKRL